MKINLVDKVVSYFNPKMGLERRQARARISFIDATSYTGASQTRKSLANWFVSGGNADDDTIPELPILKLRSRDLYRNNNVARGAINTNKTNIIGSGLKLQSRIDHNFLNITEDKASEFQNQVEREFNFWSESKNCDAANTLDFSELQELALVSTLISGDVFALLPMITRKESPYKLAIQLIESDMVRTPNHSLDTRETSGGIEVDKFGAPIAYHIAKNHPDGFVGSTDFNLETKRITTFGKISRRRNIVHLFSPERPGQRRGVPYLAPVIESLKMLGRYTEAELMAAVIGGLFTVFVTSESGDGLSLDSNQGGSGQQGANDTALGNGSIVDLMPGEKVSVANPGRPNNSFDPFVISILRQIGAALEIPLELLLKHFTSSYSASRAALLEAWKFFRYKRMWMIRNFCKPIYEEWCTEAVIIGRVKAPGFLDDPIIKKAYCQSEWIGPSPGQIDPVKETQAAKLRVEEGFSTRSQETAAITGGDFELNIIQRRKEEIMRAALLPPLTP